MSKQRTIDVAGLHLWAFSVRHTQNQSCTIWIVTEKRDEVTATRKAKRFLRGNSEYFKPTITSMENHGTLDA